MNRIRIALAGNPNSGKTTLFNALTGSNQFVGNWPGVTVEKKEGQLKGHRDVMIMDLPGIYSLSPYSLEEIIARNYLITEKPDVILNIVDGTNIERNLYLTTQLLELGIPVVVAVNMMDIVEKNGDKINLSKLSKILGCKAVSISALRENGIEEAAQTAIRCANNNSTEFIAPRYSDDVEKAISTIENMLDNDIPDSQRRYYAIKLFERDKKVVEKLKPSPAIENIISNLEKQMDDDTESIITNERYSFISNIIHNCYEKNSSRLTLSHKIDLVVTNRWLAFPIFAVVMFAVYFISVTTVGSWVTDWVNDGIFGEGWSFFGHFIPGIPILVENGLNYLGTAQWLNSLILDGIIGGVGAVLGFVPQMFVLFIILAFLEACGYMSRIAFILDRIFRKFGLSGKSFIPMLIGTGCSVPAIMSSRTIENENDRKMAIMTTSFMPCGAKLPIIALIAGAMFGGAWWVAPSAYLMGIGSIVCSSIILKKTRFFSGDLTPFVMELPDYHMPTLKTLLYSMWERGWSFIKKAGTIIMLSAVVVWFLSGFGIVNNRLVMVDDFSNGFLAVIGNIIAWIFTPLGWGRWEPAVASVTGLIAKENVVGTLGVLYGFAEVTENGTEIWGVLTSSFTVISAYSFLAFNLLCAPCFAAVGAIRREMNNAKWTWFAVSYETSFAYAVAFCIYQLGSLFLNGVFSIGTIIAFLIIILFVYLLFRPAQSEKHNKGLTKTRPLYGQGR